MSSLTFAAAVTGGPAGLKALVQASRRNYILWRFLVLGSMVGSSAGLGAILVRRLFDFIHQRVEARRKRKLAERQQREAEGAKTVGKNKVAVDKVFYNRLRLLLGICIPRIRSKPMVILTMHSLFLILRTYLSIIVARLDGRLVKDLVTMIKWKSGGYGHDSGFMLFIPFQGCCQWQRISQGSRLLVRNRSSCHIHQQHGKTNIHSHTLSLLC